MNVAHPLSFFRRPILPYLLLAISSPLLLSCSKPVPVTVARATKTTVESTISAVNAGTVTAERAAELSFGMVGIVAQMHVAIGDKVSQGQILAELENSELKTALDNARRDADRTRNLFARKVLAPTELEASVKALDIAEAAYEKSVIRAPFSGVITEENLEIGQLSQVTAPTTQALLRLVDLEKRYITADIDEVDLPHLTLGMKARVTILAVQREPFVGVIRKIVPFVSTKKEQDRTTLIELTIPTDGELLPVGASAEVEIVADQRAEAITIPTRTLLGRANDRYVFTLRDGKLSRTPVALGLQSYNRSEVISGLTEGVTVVFPPPDTDLKDGLVVSIQSEDTAWLS
jgi:HlyD family secretion protein